MFAKVESPTSLSLPPHLLKQIGSPEYLHIALDNGRLILTPSLEPKDSDEIRDYLEAAGLTEEDVEEATQWARRG